VGTRVLADRSRAFTSHLGLGLGIGVGVGTAFRGGIRSDAATNLDEIHVAGHQSGAAHGEQRDP
jgi:hypothetical protein